MSKPAKTKKGLPVFWLSLIGSIVIFILLLLFTAPERDPISPEQLPWNAHYDQQGKLHAMGLVIGESTLEDAMTLYGKDVEVKIFSKKDESDKSLEAFFPVMYIGSIKAGLALRLDASAEAIEAAYSNGKKTSLTTTGEREVELYTADAQAFFNTPILSATLVPRKNLTDRAIAMRFGEPDIKEKQSDGLDHWFYKAKGLELIIDTEGPEALQFTHTDVK